jgi:tetratricopeptide (TPR) repeat protein
MLAATVPLILLLGILECVLRLIGYGYPTTFFVKQRIDSKDYYVPNDRFGFRFFPPTIARTPFALRMPVKKPANTYRIFIFGESAAQGDPDPTFGVGRYLQVLLRERFPGTEFEVVCVAMTAINSHAVLPIARQCAGFDGDLWIVYMGNNEMVGPFGAGTIFGPKAPPLWLIRASLAVKNTRTGQLLDQILQKLGKRESAQKTWSGLNMFKEEQLRATDPGRLRAYRNFAGNLEDILAAGCKAGVPVVLSTVAVNLKDCAPFASVHRGDLSGLQKTAWENQVNAGVEFQKAGDAASAIAAFKKAAEIDGDFAELHYQMGQCEMQLTNVVAATREFELARDSDALAFRADGPINQTIVAAAKRHATDRVVLADAADKLIGVRPFSGAATSTNALALGSSNASAITEISASEGGRTREIAGEDLFYEHVHLNFEGNYRLARLFAETMMTQMAAAITARAKTEWASEEFCDQALAVSFWDRYRLWQANFSRVSEPPFTDQIDDAARAKRYMARLERLRAQMNSEAQQQTRVLYEAALRTATNDYNIHGNFAQVLAEFGDYTLAVNEQKRVCELLPFSAGAFHKAGLLLVRKNDMAAASEQFRHALSLRADYVPALKEFGEILANQQKIDKARSYFRKAIELNPGFFETYVSLGFMEQSAGKMSDALAQYEKAAELQPQGPPSYFSKAVSLANQGNSAEAIKLFQAAVWMNPTFWQARYLLGVELTRGDHVPEAEAQFAQVVRLRPDLAKAHVNLGVSLAKERKLDEAQKEFQAALALSPTNELARKHLEQVQRIKGITQ